MKEAIEKGNIEEVQIALVDSIDVNEKKIISTAKGQT